MLLTIVAFAGFYESARHAVHYADILAEALHGRLVLLHVSRASPYDSYALVSDGYHRSELSHEANTTSALYRQAEALHTPTTVEIATDLLPAVAQDVAQRHRPVLFVLGQPDLTHPAAASVAMACAELLRAGHFPLLVVPMRALATRAPHRMMIAADREPFTLAPAAQPLCQLLAQAGSDVLVAHVSSGVEDDAGCGAALRAVQASGLVGEITPELRGYDYSDYCEGVLAAVQDTQPDLVVLLARKRSFLGELFHRSVTARVLARCPVPVLVLPTGASAPRAAARSRNTAIA